MEFSGQYLTYEEYVGLGGTLDIMPFNLLEFEARRKIDTRTQNRLKDSSEIPQEVKLCEYNLIKSIEGYAKSMNESTNGNVASESIDGYSISYLTANQIGQVVASKQTELNDIIRTYLLEVKFNGQHLLFAGVEHDK